MNFVPAPRLVGIEPNPGPRKEGDVIPEEKRWRVVFHKKDLKLAPIKIAKKLKLPKKSVENIIDKFEKTGTVHDRPKKGRKRKLSTKEVKRVVKKAKKGKAALKLLTNSTIKSVQGQYGDDLEKKVYSMEGLSKRKSLHQLKKK